MKRLFTSLKLIICFFSLYSINIFAIPTWKCINKYPSDYRWQGAPVYDPVLDSIEFCYYDSGIYVRTLYISRYKENKWDYIIYGNIELSMFGYSSSNSLFDETRGICIPFWYYSYEKSSILEFQDLNIYWKKIPKLFINSIINYTAINLEPGNFIFTYNDSEPTCFTHPYSACNSFSEDMINNLTNWNSLWSASPMVWDERRNVVVKYGCGNWQACDHFCYSPSYEEDCRMREWDGSQWTLRPDVKEPQLRDCSTMLLYDEARGVVVMVGICSGTWEYDGNTWENIGQFSQPVYPDLDPRNYYAAPTGVYDTNHNRIVLFKIGAYNELWYLEDDATTQTYSRRNVMQEGCEMRTWGETGVDCALTSSTTWSRIIVVKTQDGSAPHVAFDEPTSPVLAMPILWEIKTSRPPDVIAAETTGTLISIAYPSELTGHFGWTTDTMRLCVARPFGPVGVPIAATATNADRVFESWAMPCELDAPPLPGESGVFYDKPNRRFLFRTTKEAPFYGSPAGDPRADSQPASLCYAIVNAAPDYRKYITEALLGLRVLSPVERMSLDQNSDGLIDVADLISALEK